jgi:hypothetical protein
MKRVARFFRSTMIIAVAADIELLQWGHDFSAVEILYPLCAVQAIF